MLGEERRERAGIPSVERIGGCVKLLDHGR